MAQKNGSSYPSPTAAQTGNGAGPYPGRHAEAQAPPDDLDLGVQLRQEIDNHNGSQVDINAGQGPARHDQPYQQPMYAQQAYSHMAMQPTQLGPPQAPPAVPQAISHNTPGSDDASGKKKSKASRACDECRRKKIKCDADSESPNAPACSNCRRTNSDNCRFSRTPMKRGPSKGYIKELSDRVANLEQERQKTGMTPTQASPTSLMDGGPFPGHKRTHSMSEGQHQFSTPTQPTAGAPWPYQPTPQGQSPYANMGFPGSSTAAPVAPVNGMATIPSQESSATMFTDDENATLDQYYAQSYQTLPLLPLKHEVQNLVASCSPLLRSTLFHSLLAVNRFTSEEMSQTQACKGLFMSLQSEVGSNPAHRSFLANLVYLHCFILLIIAMEMDGHLKMQSPNALSKEAVFGAAQGVIDHLKIDAEGADRRTLPEADVWQPTIRRTWFIFMILKTWNVIGYSSSSLGDGMGYAFSDKDRADLGVNVFNFARLSRVTSPCGHVIRKIDASDGLSIMIKDDNLAFIRTVKALLVTIRETIDSSAESSLAILGYWHLNLLLARLELAGTITTPPANIIASAIMVVNLLATVPAFSLSYHFIVLAAQTLIEAVNFKSSKVEALDGLKRLAQTLENDESWLESAWIPPVLKAIDAKLRAQGANDSLQHLADAAVGEGDADKTDEVAPPEETGIDWGALILDGYLGAFV